VSTPRRVKFDEDVLVIVNDKLLVCVGNDHRDRAFLSLGNRLALDAWVELSGNEIIHELANSFLGEFGAIKGKFLIFVRFLNGEGGPLANFQIEVSGMCTKRLSINGGKVDLALVLDR
jgi:hypothetical protein